MMRSRRVYKDVEAIFRRSWGLLGQHALRDWRLVDVGLWLFAFSVRAAFFGEIAAQPVFSLLMVDSKSYDLWARSIASGNLIGDTIFYQAPLYPYFVGIVYSLLGSRSVAVLWVQAVLGAFSCVLLGRAGRKFFGPREGVIAGLLFAVYPSAFFSDALIQKSSLDTFLVALLLLLLSGTEAPSPNLGCWFGIGLILGCLALTRENSIVLIGVVLLWAVNVSNRKGWWPLIERIGLIGAGTTLVLLPVGFRNLAVGGEFLLTTSQAGANFYIGNHSGADGTYQALIPGRADVRFESSDASDLAEREVGRRLSPGEVSQYWLRKSMKYISQEPGQWLRLMVRKIVLLVNRVEIADTYDQYTYARWSVLLKILNPILHFGTLLPLAILGVYFTRSRWRSIWVLHAFVVVYAGSVAFFYVTSRYRLPLVPALLLLSAAGVVGIGSMMRSDPRKAVAVCLVLGVPAAVVANWPVAAAEIAIAEATMLTNIGNGLMTERNQTSEAIPYFQEAIRIDRSHPSSYSSLGVALRRQGRSQEALPYLARAVELQPGSPESHLQLGRAYSDLGRLGDAIEQYRTVVRLDPGHAWAHYWAAGALRRMGREEEANHHMREAVRLAPGFSTFK